MLEEEAEFSEENREYLIKAIRAFREVDETLGLANKLEEIEENRMDW